MKVDSAGRSTTLTGMPARCAAAETAASAASLSPAATTSTLPIDVVGEEAAPVQPHPAPLGHQRAARGTASSRHDLDTGAGLGQSVRLARRRRATADDEDRALAQVQEQGKVPHDRRRSPQRLILHHNDVSESLIYIATCELKINYKSCTRRSSPPSLGRTRSHGAADPTSTSRFGSTARPPYDVLLRTLEARTPVKGSRP